MGHRAGRRVLTGLLLLLCLAGCTPRTPGGPLPDHAGIATLSPAPTVPTFTPVPTPAPSFTPTATAAFVPTPTPTFTPTPRPSPTPTPVPSPTPSLIQSGVYDNWAEHAEGRYELQLSGARVAATFSTTRSPVQYWAREAAHPLFTVPDPFRPPYPVLRTVEGTPVHADGTPDPDLSEPRRFLLRVDPDGAVHYVDDDHVEGVGHLAYSLDTVWGTTPAANDRAVLEILDRHWFRTTILSAEPSPVQVEVPETTDKLGTIPAHKRGTFVNLDADGRVTALGVPDRITSGYLLAELGQLHRLEHLDLGNSARIHFHLKEAVERQLAQFGRPLRSGVTAMDIKWAQEQSSTSGFHPLIGAIPPQLGHLSHLRHLDLGNNLLTGAFPPEIGSLASLEHLDLGDNWLSGPLPPAWGQLRNLEHLDLRWNLLSGPLPPAWEQLASLQTLHLSENQLSGPLPPAWGQLRNLEMLFLSGNQLSGSLPPEWDQLVNLHTLDLQINQLTGSLPPEWGQLVNLHTLILPGNQLMGSLPPEWGQLVSLRYLYLDGNQLTGSLPPEWGQLVSLQRLDLRDNQLTGCFPGIFPKLGGYTSDLPPCPD